MSESVTRIRRSMADFADATDAPPAWMDESQVSSEPAPVLRATPFKLGDPSTIPTRPRIYGTFQRGTVSTKSASGGVGKSRHSAAEAVVIASGYELLGETIRERGKVWVLNLEEDRDELQRVVAGLCLHHGVSDEDLEGHLYVDSGFDLVSPFVIAEQRGEAVTIAQPLVNELIRELRERQIDVLIVDPFVSCHNVSENSNAAIDRVAKTFVQIAVAANCAIELVHHIKKTNGAEATVEDSRGASALINAARSARVLNPMTAEEANRAGVSAEDRRRYFRVDDGKANLRPLGKASWFEIVSVGLGNGTPETPEDRVGVVTRWQWPDVLALVTPQHMEEVRRRADVAEPPYRASSQADRWIGELIAEVLGVDLEDRAAKETVKAALKEWLASGALTVIRDWQDEQSRPRPIIRAGTFKD